MAIQSMLMIFTVLLDSMIAALGVPGVTFASELIVDSKHANDTVNIILLGNIKQCVDRCQEISDCKFINYMTRRKICSMTLYVGTKAWESKVVEKFIPGTACWLKKRDEAGSTYCNGSIPFGECSRFYCNPPRRYGSMNYHGNMITVGSKKAFRCYEGAIMQSIVCSIESQWKGLNSVCGYKSVGLLDGRNILYKVQNHKANFETARSICKEEGAELLKITSKEKMAHVHQMALFHDEYFVDAKKIASRNWITSDGHAIPQGADIWNEFGWNRLMNGIIQHTCATLIYWKLEPKSCDSTSPFICELYVE